jgi:putative FmdB family regulatory protein
MPTYEYRCPKGHTFELFQRMTDPPAESCGVCGAKPVEKVLFPVAVHFKGSGFYSTDYGRGSRKGTAKDGDGGSGGDAGSEKKDSSATSGGDTGTSTASEKKTDSGS